MTWSDKRRIGTSEVYVTGLGLGAAALPGLYEQISETLAIETVESAYSQGINYFDVAPRYGNGIAERRLGLALRGLERGSYVVSTKIGWRLEGSGSVPDFSADNVFRSLETSLERMGLDRIDIVYVHDPDHHENEAMDGAFPALLRLREQGVVRAIGAGMNSWEPLARFVEALPLDCVLLAGRFTLLEQGAKPLLDLARDRSVSVVIGGVFNSGILAAGPSVSQKYNYRSAPPEIVAAAHRLEEACTRLSVPLMAAALHFPFLDAAVTSVLVGFESPTQVQKSVGALARSLPAELWSSLEECGLIQKLVPMRSQGVTRSDG